MSDPLQERAMDEAGPSMGVPSAADSTDLAALPPACSSSDHHSPSDHPAQPELSKNQRKKLAKREAWLAARPAKRRLEKEKKKQKAAERRARVEAGEVDDEPEEGAKKRRRRDKQGPAFMATIVMDCAFDELMTEKEVSSLQSQLAHSYSINRHALTPFDRILITSLSGRLHDRFKAVYHNDEHLGWTRISFSARSWQDLASGDPSSDADHLKKQDVVYLTADSPNVLDELDEGKVYVIGALVDRNRHKNICFNRAVEAGVAHAQLPFGQHMSELKTRRVLTVNQVFDILSNWLSNRDWRAALEAVVPLRKFRDAAAAGGSQVGAVGEEDGES